MNTPDAPAPLAPAAGSAAEMERARCLAAVDAEAELPGDMPDEMWEAIRNDRGAMVETLRIVVRLTKYGIRKRILPPNATGSPTGQEGRQ